MTWVNEEESGEANPIEELGATPLSEEFKKHKRRKDKSKGDSKKIVINIGRHAEPKRLENKQAKKKTVTHKKEPIDMFRWGGWLVAAFAISFLVPFIFILLIGGGFI